jgi:subtilase family serine protease
MAGALALAAAVPCALAQPANRIPARIDESQVVTLWGNVHPLARAEFDQGEAAPELRLDRMLLLLKPSASQQTALDALVAAQHDPRSPAFHQWLTPASFATRFGAGASDLGRIHDWLEAHGFTVEEIPAGNRLVIFSGTAAQVSESFHAGIHRYRVGGVDHIANSQAPQIPAALAGVVGGIVSIDDFRRAPAMTARQSVDATTQWTLNGAHYLFPSDFATIYDLNPLYSAGTTGEGTAIAIAGRSNISLSDVEAFRASAALKDNKPTVILDGNDPGLVEVDQDESTLDVEWAGAVAPAATVKLVAAASTSATDGVDLSAQYIVNHALAQVVSVSYGSCEQQMGAAELAFYNSLWQQAASEGISVLVASGDAGAAGCNLGSDSTGSVAGVNGLCSPPYSTCVGGTEFNENSNPSQYWAKTNNPNQGSALGYIPETVWNESGADGGAWLWASGGGISQVYAQPPWQQDVSGSSAANGMRAVPDVSFAAASHDGYIIFENGSNWIVSGTSAAAPSLAGVMALVVEANGGVGQGNANVSFYALATAGADPFHATLSGTNSVPDVAGFAAGSQPYNLATGLGSVDAALLVDGWKSAAVPPPTLSLAAAPGPIVISQGASASMQLTAATGGSFAGNVTLSVAGLPAGVSAVWSRNPIAPQAGAGAATLTLFASALARSASMQVAITAQGSGLTVTRQVTVQVRPFRLPIRRPPHPIIVSPPLL